MRTEPTMHAKRARRLAELRQLAANGRWLSVYRRTTLWEFPGDARLGFQLAFLVPFTVPDMAKTLVDHGGIIRDPLRRGYHTGLIIHELIAQGPDGEAGTRLVAHMNRLHHTADIPAEQMRFVLNGLIVLPTRFIQRAGWRPLDPVELEATVRFYDRLGHLMGIPNRPRDYDEAARQFDQYAAAQIRPSREGALLGEALLEVLRARFPRPLRPIAPRVFSAIIDPPAASKALALPPTGRRTAAALDAALALRKVLTARRPPPSKPSFTSGQPVGAIYPSGYDIEDITGHSPML